MFDGVRHDLGYAVRGFVREPGFALIAVVILALGIGANTAVFSVVNPLLLRPLPFPDSDRLIWIANTGDTGLSGATYQVGTFEAMRRESRSFQSLTAYFAFFGYGSYKLTGDGPAERLVGVDVADGFFELLGVQPEVGRLFTADEMEPAGPPQAMLVSHGLWVRRFGADPAIVGQAVQVNDVPITVVGVLPATFDFSTVFAPGTNVDLFVPKPARMRDWGNTLAIVGRLKPGVTLEAARAEFESLVPRIREANPELFGFGARLSPLKQQVSGHLRRSLAVLWGAVGLVLLIVCANLSNLLLARTASRSKEFAVRIALGAGRGRLLQQLVIEGVLLAAVGAAAGIPLAYGLTAWLKSSVTLSIPLLDQVVVDTDVLAFTAIVSLLCGVAVAIVPAIRLAGRDPQDALREQSRGSTDSRRHAWVRSSLVVVEVALASVLLVGAALLLRSFVELLDVELGFRPSQAVAVRVDPPSALSGEERAALLDEVTRRVSALPGVQAAGLSDALPLERNRTWNVGVDGQTYPDDQMPLAFVYVTGPGYFEAMGIPLEAGRGFTEHDTADGQRVMIVNETLARVLYPDRDPLGLPARSGPNVYRIIGVVADVRQTSLEETSGSQMYLSHRQVNAGSADLIVRSSLPATALAAAVRQTVGALDPTLIASEFRPVTDLVDRSVSPRRFLVSLIGGFAGLALLLASLGIYGVVSYAVSQRIQEIGVRMALGATAREVRRHILGGTMKLAFLGVAIGLVMSLALGRVLAALLYGTSPADPAAFAGTALVLASVALIAGYIPALRASRVEPMTALRTD